MPRRPFVRRLIILGLLTAAACAFAAWRQTLQAVTPQLTGFGVPVSKGKANVPTRYAGTIPAPEFPAGIQWLNSDKPLFLRDLKGKVVLLDFWTYC